MLGVNELNGEYERILSCDTELLIIFLQPRAIDVLRMFFRPITCKVLAWITDFASSQDVGIYFHLPLSRNL